VTTGNAPTVAEICSRLDGLPLAIELAAARVKVLPPQALLTRLEQRLPLLTGGARTLPARQQTMHDAIAWSHDLLSPEEQTLFRRLAIFPSGCTIDAAEAVAGAEGTLDVFTGIATLVDESLLRQEEGSAEEPRFRMLETVREYGLGQLETSGEGDTIRDRLALWGVALAEQVEPDQFGGEMAPTWVDRLEEELPNLRAAIN
jgi:predicted ATPase